MMKLSPLNQAGLLFHTFRPQTHDAIGADRKKERRQVIEITQYQCPDCFEKYDWEEDAEKCCAPEENEREDNPDNCPVCGEEYTDPWGASNCCLWKDIDAQTCWQIANSVYQGATWYDAITQTWELKSAEVVK